MEFPDKSNFTCVLLGFAIESSILNNKVSKNNELIILLTVNLLKIKMLKRRIILEES